MSEDLVAEFQLDERIIHKAIQKLKSEKLDGDKGLCSHLVINAPTSWRLVLKSLIECMIVHGHYERELLLSTLNSLPKNKVGDVCNSDSYRGIALTSCINKVLDWVNLLKYANYLKTSNLQFANKKRHSTAMCTLALKEVAKDYTSRRGRVYCCLLDATKAFGRVRFDKFLKSLLNEMCLPVLFEFSLTCIQGKQFVQYGKVVFQMNFLQITGCDKGTFCHLYSSACILTFF